ncbi:hypothetical protein MUA31_09955 [Staphylococcus simulans]|uniref:hypothetical protein n=1 Tax=Staphylococcus simulans TaxID=1286 RepID=UPI0021CF70AE|nr:hypothetical protein [Staphylococcus simulans]UXR34703.1 hypothetical protein MUA31_09955 [Staphylococcus simulans]
MSQEQAIEIVEYANNIYEMNMSKEKAKLWLEMLTKNADYEPSKKAFHEYIMSGNPYPPILPNIIRKSPKLMKFDEVDEKTKQHRYRMQHDPAYRAEKKRLLDDFKKKLVRNGSNIRN